MKEATKKQLEEAAKKAKKPEIKEAIEKKIKSLDKPVQK